MGVHVFRDAGGDLRFYPPFVAYAGGYDVIVWDDMDERETNRAERLARDRAEKLWNEANPDEATARFERRTSMDIGRGCRGIRVVFSTKPLKALG